MLGGQDDEKLVEKEETFHGGAK